MEERIKSHSYFILNWVCKKDLELLDQWGRDVALVNLAKSMNNLQVDPLDDQKLVNSEESEDDDQKEGEGVDNSR